MNVQSSVWWSEVMAVNTKLCRYAGVVLPEMSTKSNATVFRSGKAPMSVRLWLMLAECWNCGTVIELNDEQVREVERVRETSPPAAVASAPPPPAPSGRFPP